MSGRLSKTQVDHPVETFLALRWVAESVVVRLVSKAAPRETLSVRLASAHTSQTQAVCRELEPAPELLAVHMELSLTLKSDEAS